MHAREMVEIMKLHALRMELYSLNQRVDFWDFQEVYYRGTRYHSCKQGIHGKIEYLENRRKEVYDEIEKLAKYVEED